MTQWHPIFDYLLRAALKDYYEVQTNVPVGDLPREADIVLVRRTTTSKTPFRTLWKHLTRWNALEFKGRSESARENDIDLLVEVGLGIHRRLREQEPNAKIARRDVSFWYLANHLGKRFLRDVVELIGTVEPVAPGLWRGQIVGRAIWLVSNGDVPIDAESAPVRAVSEQSPDEIRALAEEVIANSNIWEIYCGLLGMLHPSLRQAFQAMAKKQKKGDIDWEAFINSFDDAEFDQLLRNRAARKGTDGILELLSPKMREEMLRRLQTEFSKGPTHS